MVALVPLAGDRHWEPLYGDLIEINHHSPITTMSYHKHQVQVLLWMGDRLLGYEPLGNVLYLFLSDGWEYHDGSVVVEYFYLRGQHRLSYRTGGRSVELRSNSLVETHTEGDAGDVSGRRKLSSLCC